MGRKTNTLITFLLALTCVTGAKKYADRSDQDPSTVWQPYEEDDESWFNSRVYEMEKGGAKSGGDTTDGPVLEEIKTDFVTTVNHLETRKGKRRQRIRRSLSSLYHDNEFHTVRPDAEDEIPVEDISMAVDPLPAPLTQTTPLKGILRPPGPRPKSNKKVHFQRRPVVYYYNPGGPHPVQKCGDFTDGACELEEGRCSTPRRPPLKSTKWLKTGLRHLFYQ
jgi:hypothetical protein